MIHECVIIFLMYEKKTHNNVTPVSGSLKQYKRPLLTKLGDCKTLTKGGQVNYPADNSGWANKNTTIS